MPECKLVVPDCVQVRILMSAAPRPMTIVQHAVATPTFTPSVTIANNMLGRLGSLLTSSGLAAQMNTSVGIAAVTLKDLRGPDLPDITSDGTPHFGTGTGDPLPFLTAAVMTIRTARAGKQFRGRSYWTGFTEAANSSGQHFDTAMVTAFNAFCAGYIGAFNGDGLSLGVMHRPLFTKTPDACTITTPGFVTAATQTLSRDSLWETQRRRTR